jgi:hypothetical protein
MRRIFLAALFLIASGLPSFAQQTAPFHLISAASTNATSIKPAPGQIVTIVGINTTAVIYYLKFYDISATPTCNTTPVVLSFPIPIGTSSAGGGAVIPLPQAVQFLNGIGMCLTGGINDNDNTIAATGVAIDVFFK